MAKNTTHPDYPGYTYDGGLGPVYGHILPLINTAVADLKDWVNNNPDDTDAVVVSGILRAAAVRLEDQDTTVRETY